ncbi:GTP 3',8-cyclase MoaA [Croceicoccus sp. F390]|uniref:GTP 3',8-cyclase n=1 Tax=Croceicoccus esteveae TaxID=3075597 RepID=A0ABU2ZHH8_9SPHN|nr:GTP 3',8-cyclase MoaA [Croceicoccus sp. F390]MDT0576058.1 GTP 3',8-cyclase MoaA [Croceicoccus sp. F390]
MTQHFDPRTVDRLSLQPAPMVDSFGRHITYVRVSVTDRCDLRCRYCMAEKMTFMPRRDLLSFEDIIVLADVLISRGVRRIRLTGGEPLVRRDVMQLVDELGSRIGKGLDELTLTTNGTQLAGHAEGLFAAGVRRINVSLDSLDPERFSRITRRGRLDQVLDGIEAAAATGLAIKINMVALAGVNADEFDRMLAWCSARGFDLTLIETMPLGEIEDHRPKCYLSLQDVLADLQKSWTLIPSLHRSGGPARYYDVAPSGTRLGLITPMSHNFCDGCNRIRIAATGTVYGCLGHEQKVELRDILRQGGPMAVDAALDDLLAGKPRRHQFDLTRPATARHMSVTGG